MPGLGTGLQSAITSVPTMYPKGNLKFCIETKIRRQLTRARFVQQVSADVKEINQM